MQLGATGSGKNPGLQVYVASKYDNQIAGLANEVHVLRLQPTDKVRTIHQSISQSCVHQKPTYSPRSCMGESKPFSFPNWDVRLNPSILAEPQLNLDHDLNSRPYLSFDHDDPLVTPLF